MPARIRRVLQKVREKTDYLRHRVRLSQRVASTAPEYQHYLDTQLQRTLSKKDAVLPIRAARLIDKVSELVDLQHSDVLCIGCRNTAEIDYFRAKGARIVTGIDLYSESQDIQVMDMHHMTFPDNHFDVVYSSHSLEHAYDVSQAINEIIRVARPGASAVIEMPVQYKAQGADIVDVGNLENLYATFGAHLGQVLWSEEQAANDPLNDTGTAIIRVVFSISKATSQTAQ